MKVAHFTCVIDRRNRDPCDFHPVEESLSDNLDLQFEPGCGGPEFLQEFASMQPVSALIIVYSLAQHPAQEPGAERVCMASWKGHFGKIPPTNDQFGIRSPLDSDEIRDFGRIVLAIGVKRDNLASALLQRPSESGHQSETLAPISLMPDDLCAGAFGHARGIISRTIIHNQDGKVLNRLLNHRSD